MPNDHLFEKLFSQAHNQKSTKPTSTSLDFFETQVIQSQSRTQIEDMNDDIKIEVEIYKNTLESAKEAVQKFQLNSRPFFRPSDYFGEMVKSDSHMEMIRLKLVQESENIKLSQEAKKRRELKKFGKAIQIEKKLEREKESKRVKEGVKDLRKKRKDRLNLESTNEEDFDIALEETLSNTKKPGRPSSEPSRKKPRSARDHKFGHPKPKGVIGRRWKANTKESSNNFEGMGGRGDGRITSGMAKGRRRGGSHGAPGHRHSNYSGNLIRYTSIA
ncbi:hypothetical protein O181_020231 [Austropuccinia psidii MF-1]|uniref:rRNA-processing protein EBP2 n=1 Tax=Austropuccinia psidii MF-1 TaxID=1389203 RepID=A0A9Q3CD29_9BASI|nr:hypothetical protein [Austropuccinia psidii MF-1]